MTRHRYVRAVVFLFAICYGLPACAQEPQVKVARLLRSVKDGRTNKGGDMKPSDGSVVLMVRFEVTKADAVPLSMDVYNVQAVEASGKTYPVFGIFDANIDSQTVTVAFRPVGIGSGMSEVTESAHSSGVDSDSELKNYGPEAERTAKVTLKKIPGGFALFFVVPATPGAYDIRGLSPKPLRTGNLALPPPEQK